MKVTFSGASDDLIHVSPFDHLDEVNAIDGKVDGDPWYCDLSDPEGHEVRVTAIYDGCWSFAVGLADEDDVFPEWPIKVRQSETTSYSVELEIEVPDGTTASASKAAS